MEISISKKLKALRQIKKNTQEELAEFLSVSPQAVSKWERNEGYPDIVLLPRIAGYYHVSVDELLGVDEIAKQERIDEITAEYNKIRHHIPLDPDYGLDEGIELIRKAVRELPGVFFFEQLLASDLSWKGKNTSCEVEREKLFEEATELCRDILARSTEDRWRDSAKQILLVTYAEQGKNEKALELAYQMPGPWCTCEYMLTYIHKGEELKNTYKLNAVLYYQIFRQSILKLKESSVEAEDMVNNKELKIAGIDDEEYLNAIRNVI